MQSKSNNHTHRGIGSLASSESAHLRVDNQVELANVVETDRNNRSENKVLFSHADYQVDGHKRQVNVPSVISEYRTTFYVFDIDADKKDWRSLFNRLWKYQTGRGHTWEDSLKQKQIVRNDATWKRCDAILQSCEVGNWIKDQALRMTISQELQGFNRYYAGADGACIGFTLRLMYQSTDQAKDSWVAKKAANVVPEFDPETVNNLVDYVFRKYD